MKKEIKRFLIKIFNFIFKERIRMSKEAAESRIKQLEQAIEQSKSDIEQRHANHNALIGALNEAKNMLSLIFEESVKEDEEKGPEVV